MKKDFLFSVIITIYNAEDYLEEAIKSITKQTIGFEKNIQLILVNNASEDDCDIICKKYKEKYPNNIEYIEIKKNRRAAGGRNAGLPYVKGKYFNYLDADDIWPKNVFKKVYAYFEKNYDSIDIVSCRRRHFGRYDSFHAVDYKFTKENRIIDISEEYRSIQLHVTSCFFKTENCIDKRFNEGINIGEDHEYINSLILKQGKYAAMNNKVMYLYRKREDGKSALDNKTKSKTYFVNDYPKILSSISENSIKNFGKVIPFCQYDFSYETGYLLKESTDILEDKEKKDLKAIVKKFAQNIDDEIIATTHIINREYKAFYLDIKHGDGYVANLPLDKLKELNLFRPKNKKNFSLDILEIENDKLILGALVSIILDPKRWEVYLKDKKGNKYYPTFKGGDIETKSLGETIFVRRGMIWEIDLKNIDSLELYPTLKIDGVEYNTNLRCGKWSKASNDVSRSYYYKKSKDNSYIATYTRKKLTVKKNASRSKYEAKFLLKIIRDIKPKALFYRLLIDILPKFIKKDIWIISDRSYSADGNGEFFYKWLIDNNKDKEIKPYYVLDRKSEDAKRVKKYGKIVQHGTFKYKVLYLLSEVAVVAMMDDFLNYLPMNINNKYFLDKQTRTIAVGHGISEQDISQGEARFKKNFRIYTVASKREQLAKETRLYGYSDNEIKIIGTPRQDGIYEASQGKKGKSIMFAPTWRKGLSGVIKKGERLYSSVFSESEYFKFFNDLINDKRILKAMKDNGYTGVFNLHPAHKENFEDFDENDLIKIQNRNESYLDQFKNNRMVVTDYSSIGHDYAYANSYVIYSQFDKDEFYSNHVYKEGSFNYEKDGFGPVCYDYESTVKAIIKAIANDCKVEKKYSERTKKYFKYFDNKNCERIYKEIRKLGKYK